MLSIENLSCKINHRDLFSKLSFTLLPGCIMIIKGANGIGKTTLLKCLSGLIKPSTGKISYFHKDIYEYSDEYNQEMFFLNDNWPLYDQLTLKDNLLYWTELRGTSILLPMAIEFFGITPFLNYKVENLSAGWKKKLSLTLMMSSMASIWLMDEPTVFLDNYTIDKLIGCISVKAKENGGIHIITTNSNLNIPDAITINLEDYLYKN